MKIKFVGTFADGLQLENKTNEVLEELEKNYKIENVKVKTNYAERGIVYYTSFIYYTEKDIYKPYYFNQESCLD